MDFQQHLPFISILTALLAAIITPLFKDRKTSRSISIIVMTIIVTLSAILTVYTYKVGYFTYQLGHYPAPWGNELRAGSFESIMALTFGTITLLSIIGGAKSASHDIEEEKQKYYYLMLNLLTASLLALIYTNDIFTAYVFLEINAVAACAIVVAKVSGDTIKATIKYFVMNVLGSGLYLLAISILYSITGHLLMSNMRDSIMTLPSGYMFPLTVAIGLIFVGLAVKSALFPFHIWLPDAHGSATPTSSAILSGVVLKGYVILLIKIIYRVYGLETIRQLNIFPIILVLGLMGIIFGSIYAIVQEDLKKMIAYSSVAQIGYIFMGIGLGTAAGLLAAAFNIIVHSVTKSMLFISAGNLIEMTGSKKIKDLDGMAYEDRISALGFTIGGLSMVGIPFFGGFIAKLMFIESALDSKFMLITLISLAISTLLNALYYFPVILRMFKAPVLKKKAQCKIIDHEFKAEGAQKYSLVVLMILNVLLGVLSKPLIGLLSAGLNNIG